MSAVRGWCPDLHRPMPSGDGFLVRIRPPLGRLHTAQALALAATAQRYADGQVALTNRGNLQLRGLRASDIAPVASAMVACGLALADPMAERRRRVIVSPGRHPEAAAIERALLADTSFDRLQDKFSVLVGSGCEADITVRDGHAWVTGAARAVVATTAAVAALAQVSRRLGRGRMRDLGAEAVYAAAGLCAELPVPLEDPTGVGAIAPGIFAGAPIFGEMDADTLVTASRLGDGFASGFVHVAPWRALAFTGVRDHVALGAALARAGLIADPADPRLRITACVGQPRCAQASVDTHRDAARLPPTPTTIHVSGCAKGCAHPGPAALTFVGRDGRYDLVRAGRAGDPPAVRGLAAHELAAWVS